MPTVDELSTRLVTCRVELLRGRGRLDTGRGRNHAWVIGQKGRNRSRLAQRGPNRANKPGRDRPSSHRGGADGCTRLYAPSRPNHESPPVSVCPSPPPTLAPSLQSTVEQLGCSSSKSKKAVAGVPQVGRCRAPPSLLNPFFPGPVSRLCSAHLPPRLISSPLALPVPTPRLIQLPFLLSVLLLPTAILSLLAADTGSSSTAHPFVLDQPLEVARCQSSTHPRPSLSPSSWRLERGPGEARLPSEVARPRHPAPEATTRPVLPASATSSRPKVIVAMVLLASTPTIWEMSPSRPSTGAPPRTPTRHKAKSSTTSGSAA